MSLRPGKSERKTLTDKEREMISKTAGTIITIILSLGIIGSGAADTVILQNGDRISGKDCSVRNGKAAITTDYAKTVTVDLSSVEKISFDSPVPAETKDGTKRTVTELTTEEITAGGIVMVNVPPPPPWTLDLSAGYALNSGNSNTEDVNIQLTVVRLVEKMLRLTLHGEYFWGTAEDDNTGKDETVTDRGLASLQADIFLIDNGYTYARSEYSYDKMNDLDRRIDNGLGIGYQVLNTDDYSLNLEAGADYIDSKYDDGSKEHGIYIRLAENSQFKLNDRLMFIQSIEYKPRGKNFNDYLLNASASIRVSLMTNLYFKVSVIDRYDNNPAAGKKPNDVAVISSLGFNL